MESEVPGTDSRLPQWGVVPVRGGVGATTLAGALELPELDSSWQQTGWVLVVDGTADGMAALDPLADAVNARTAPTVLAVVDDGAGPRPPIVSARAWSWAGIAQVVFVPHVPRWRYEGTHAEATKRWTATMNVLRDLITPTKQPHGGIQKGSP